MLWSEIKKWAKDLGYETLKDKSDGQYYWAKLDDHNTNASGVVSSVSKLAKAIYNHHTNDRWIEHQNQFQLNKEEKRISLTDYGT